MPDSIRLVVSAFSCASRHATQAKRGEEDGCAYRVAWAINPHMRVGAVHPRRALRQYGRFIKTLERLGAEVIPLPFVHGAYDSIFVKDNAVLVQRPGGAAFALLATPLHPERRAEQKARAESLASRGFRVCKGSAAPLEGGDVAMLPFAEGALLGHGFRSSPGAASDLARFLGAPVTCLELCDPRLYHLDMAVSVLSDGTALVCEEALTPESRATLRRIEGLRSVVSVPLDEALSGFALNLVEVGKDVVLSGESPSVFAALRARGYRPHVVPLGEFHHGGGSAACMVSRVHAQSTNAWSTTAAIRSTAA